MSETTTTTRTASARRSRYKVRGKADVQKAGAGSVPSSFEDHARPTREVEPAERLTRRSRHERSVEAMEVPKHRQKPGWSYQFYPISILNQPVDASVITDLHLGGWRPVPPADMPELIPPGMTVQHVDVQGQRLYMRPLRLTQDAQKEDFDAAQEQMVARMDSARRGRVGGDSVFPNVRGLVPNEGEISVVTEVGTYKDDPRGSRG